MQLSHYLKVFPCKERPDHLLLYSTKQASVVRIHKETFQSIKTNTLSSSDETLLSKLGMMTTDSEAEKSEMLHFLETLTSKDTSINIIAVLNLDCNFSCIYCFEGEMKGKKYMSGHTADRLVNFIKSRLSKDKTDLVVDFYGGEPLLSSALIQNISRALKSIINGMNGSFGFTLVTNGSLFTRKVAETLVPLGLKSAKITLDGPADVHNRYRPFKTGAGSFDAIIKNIKETCDLVNIQIGGNYDRPNYSRFVLLLDYLEREGLTPEKISVVKFDPIIQRFEEVKRPMVESIGCKSINEPWILEAEALLREAILKRGYYTPKPKPICCMVENKDAVVVNYDGLLYKCPAFLGIKDFAVGDLQTGIKDYTDIYKLDIWKNRTCMRCEYLPICFGGCRYMTYVRSGHIDTVDCKKDYLDAALEILIKQDIAYRSESEYLPVKTKTNPGLDLNDMIRPLNGIITKYFPEQFKLFAPPSQERIFSFYQNVDNVIQCYVLGTPSETAEEPVYDEQALLSVAAIRYVDDFIDHALWPDIPRFDPNELSVWFDRFLNDVYILIKRFDQEMPEEILSLPKLELRLTLDPCQENFDQHFINLFQYKSYDMFYIFQKIHKVPITSIGADKFIRLAVIDYIRDFSPEAIDQDTDMNLYKFIRDNHINPQRLLDFLLRFYQKEDPAGYRSAKLKGGFKGIQTDDSFPDDEDIVTSIPFHESFASLFIRAVRLLQNLF